MKIDFYEINIPNGWEVKEEENITSLFNSQGFGVLQISSFLTPREYEINLFDELYDFVSTYISITNNFEEYKNVKKINYGLLLDELTYENRKWLFAILNVGEKILLITYNSFKHDFYKEHNIVLETINSVLIPLTQE